MRFKTFKLLVMSLSDKNYYMREMYLNMFKFMSS